VFGHENLGIVHEVGSAVTSIERGDRVVMPFNVACGFCKNCVELRLLAVPGRDNQTDRWRPGGDASGRNSAVPKAARMRASILSVLTFADAIARVRSGLQTTTRPAAARSKTTQSFEADPP
jgi:Zn-dependent alcohol dehydrogenase